MFSLPMVSFEQFRSDPEKIKQFPLTPLVLRTIWESNISSTGQWQFTQEELDLLALYVREGTVKKWIETCLMPSHGHFFSKGSDYFKEYSKSYNSKHFVSFLHDLLQLLDKISSTRFEEEDLTLRTKTLLVIAEELLNHLCWGVYLAYIAGGIRNNVRFPNLHPEEIAGMNNAMLLASRIYLSLFMNAHFQTSEWSDSLRVCFEGKNLGFISYLASQGTRGADGTFFRLRPGCHEIQNAIHALKVREILKGESIALVVGQFYGGLSCGVLAYASLIEQMPGLLFSAHVYSTHENHVKLGEWEGKNRREILARISHIPSLIRPYSMVEGKKVLIIAHALGDGRVLRGLKQYYTELGAEKVYLSAVEGCIGDIDFSNTPWKYQDMEIAVPPTFIHQGPAALRHLQKEVAEKKTKE